MSERIKLLPEIVANQIAAGEVVEQPASVVKEMMENAIDAGAHTVKVNYRGGGLELIQIADDGCGMSPIDARLAFDRHATSKITSADDIYALTTFGFRGEALASIAAVSQVELRTRQAEDELGTSTEIKGGVYVRQEQIMCPQGAQFLVRNLFYNVPARRRHFETRIPASATQIKNEFQRVALCYPQTAFELYANDAPIYSLSAGSLANRIVDVVGRHIKQNLLEVAANTSIASLSGYIGRPSAAKKRNAEQFLFVNGRYFKSNYVTSAVLRAYDKLIADGVQPSFFLYLTVDPSRLDINIHPQKTEVRFADEQAIWQIVHAAVRESLAKSGAVPMMDFDPQTSIEIPVYQRGTIYAEPAAMSDSNYNPFNEIDPDDSDTGTSGLQNSRNDTYPRRNGGIGKDTRTPNSSLPKYGDDEPEMIASGWNHDTLKSSWLDIAEFDELRSESNHQEEDEELLPSGENDQTQLTLNTEQQFVGALPYGGMILSTLGGRLVVVDVRRAHERILHTEYLKMLDSGVVASQKLLFPDQITLSVDEYALLKEHAVEFSAIGFDLQFDTEEKVTILGIPAELPADAVDRTLYELLQAFASPVSLGDIRRDRIATPMARAAARNASRIRTPQEATALLDRLVSTGAYSFSPSGKTIIAEISEEDLRSRLG